VRRLRVSFHTFDEYANSISEVTNFYSSGSKVDVLLVGDGEQSQLHHFLKSRGANVKSWHRSIVDLTNVSQFDSAKSKLLEMAPHHVFVMLPHSHICNSADSRVLDNPGLLKRFHQQSKRQRLIWRNSLHLALLQLNCGNHVHVMTPAESKCYDRMVKEDEVTREFLHRTTRAVHHACTDSQKDKVGKIMNMKYRIQSSCNDMVNTVASICHNKHEHSTADTTHSCLMTDRFITKVGRYMLQHRDGIVAHFEDIARDIKLECSEQCCAHSDDVLEELENQICEPCAESREPDSTAFPVVHDILKDSSQVPDDAEEQHMKVSKVKLLTIHKNLGHPSSTILTKILKEAKAPQSIIDLVPSIQCDICERMRRVRPARPTKALQATQMGGTLGLDLSLFKQSATGRRALILHMVDEASKFHVCKVIKEDKEEAKAPLGNIDVVALIQSLKDCWLRFFQSPKNIHCDSEGVSNS